MEPLLTFEGVADRTVEDGGRALVLEVDGTRADGDGEYVRLQSWREDAGEHPVLGPLAGRRLRVTVEVVEVVEVVEDTTAGARVVSLPSRDAAKDQAPAAPWSTEAVDKLVIRARELFERHGTTPGWALLLAELLDPTSGRGPHGETHLLALALATAVSRLATQDTGA